MENIMLGIMILLLIVGVVLGTFEIVYSYKEFTEATNEKSIGRFVDLQSADDNIKILVDTETGVQYIYSYIGDKGFGYGALVDSEGKPILYEGDLD